MATQDCLLVFFGVPANLSFLCTVRFKYSLSSVATISDGRGDFPRYRFETQELSSDLYCLEQDKLEFLERRGTNEIKLPYTFAGRYECEVTANPDSQML
jgi:hypothetical protein